MPPKSGRTILDIGIYYHIKLRGKCEYTFNILDKKRPKQKSRL